MSPRVSVLLPARNAASTLPSCLESIRRQRKVDFECVVVDDGSSDSTGALARRWADCDPRFRVIRGEGRGLVAALQRGLAACRGRYVARMDADDWMHRERLGAQVAALEADPRLAGVGCHVRIHPRRGLRPGLRDYEVWLRSIDSARAVRRERWIECPLPHPSWMLRAQVMAAAGYRDRGWPEDYDLLLRILESGASVGVVPRRLLGWRDGAERHWRTHPAYTPERFLACKAHYLARGPLRHGEAYALWGYGETGKSLRRALASEGRMPGYIVEVHPRRVGERIHGAPVVRPEQLPSLPRLPIVTAVSGAFARGEIRAQLLRLGFREEVDFWCAA